MRSFRSIVYIELLNCRGNVIADRSFGQEQLRGDVDNARAIQ